MQLQRLRAELRQLEGILGLRLDRHARQAIVEVDDHHIEWQALTDALARVPVSQSARRLQLHISHLHLDDAGRDLQEVLGRLNGVQRVEVSLQGGAVTVDGDPDEFDPATVVPALIEAGYIVEEGEHHAAHEDPTHALLTQVGLPTALLVVGMALFASGGDRTLWAFSAGGLHPTIAISALFFAATVVLSGRQVVPSALQAVRNRVLSAHVLVVLAVIGAVLIDRWWEAAVVMLVMALAEILEELALQRTRQEIAAIMTLAPTTANVRRDESVVEVSATSIEVGDVVVVRTGETVGADGIIVDGRGEVSLSSITGESLPVPRAIGDEVPAGAVVESGYLEVAASRPGHDSTVQRIVELVGAAQEGSAQRERTVQRFTAIFVPLVLILAVAALLLSGDPEVALTLLVVACPCALVIATPVSVLTALGRAARQGVLIKGGVHLETAATVRSVALDKTGTLTRGRLEVLEVVPIVGDRNGVLAAATVAEARSEHPIAAAVLRAAAKAGMSVPRPEEGAGVMGAGVTTTLRGRTYRVGNAAFLQQQGLSPPETLLRRISEESTKGTLAVLVAVETVVIGAILLRDTPRPSAATAVRQLQELGLSVLLLSGDAQGPTAALAQTVGIEEHYAPLLPHEKMEMIEELKEWGPVAMVGEGVNDAPAVATADVGIALLDGGSDVAVEAADIAIVGDDLRALPFTIALSRATAANILQNVAFSGAVAIALVVLALSGIVGIVWGVVLHETAALVVLFNALRLTAFDRAGAYGRPRPVLGEGGADLPRPLMVRGLGRTLGATILLFMLLIGLIAGFTLAVESHELDVGSALPLGGAPPVEYVLAQGEPVQLSGTTAERESTEQSIELQQDRIVSVNASLSWTDEAATSPLATNQPDSFTLTLRSPLGDEVSKDGANAVGSAGSLTVLMELTAAQQQALQQHGANATWIVVISCTDAGDQRGLVRTIPDDGNAWQLEVDYRYQTPK